MMSSAEDERQVIALVNRYATALDSADWALLRTCWADDVDVDYDTGEIWTSGDVLNDFMVQAHVGLTTMHMNGNFVMDDIAPGRAKGRTYFKAIVKRPDGSYHLRADGWYDDEFTRIASEWKITRRKVRMIELQIEGQR
jgi:hypothetical protein